MLIERALRGKLHGTSVNPQVLIDWIDFFFFKVQNRLQIIKEEKSTIKCRGPQNMGNLPKWKGIFISSYQSHKNELALKYT